MPKEPLSYCTTGTAGSGEYSGIMTANYYKTDTIFPESITITAKLLTIHPIWSILL